MLKVLKGIVTRQDSEEIRAIYSSGKYRLSKEYRQFQVDSGTWHKWDEKRKRQHVQQMRNFTPSPADFYVKLSIVGKKPNQTQRKRKATDPVVFVDRVKESSESVKQSVSPIVLKKKSKQKYTISKKPSSCELSRINPKRTLEKTLTLCLKSKHPRVRVCHGQCGSPITNNDLLMVKTVDRPSTMD